MKCYEIKTANTTYLAKVLPGKWAHNPLMAMAEPWERDTVIVYGGRFGVIHAWEMPKRNHQIFGESGVDRVQTSPVVSVKRISRKRFLATV